MYKKNFFQYISSRRPVPIGSDSDDYYKDAESSPYADAIALGDLVKTTLGPKGDSKLIGGNKVGELNLSSDGATILRSLDNNNPAAHILIKTADVHGMYVGDGVTAVTVFAAELLKEAEQMMKENIQPKTIASGWKLAKKIANDALLASVQNISLDSKRISIDLINIAKSTICSQLLRTHNEHFAKLAVRAVLHIKDFNYLEAIQIIKKTGKDLKNSYLVDGYLLENPTGGYQTKRIKNAKILFASSVLHMDQIISRKRLSAREPENLVNDEKYDRELTNKKVKMILSNNCDIFVHRDFIVNYSDEIFIDAKIMTINSNFDVIRSLALLTGGQILSILEGTHKINTGQCDLIEKVMVEDDTLILFSGFPNCNTCTIVIFGETQLIVEEAERCLRGTLSVLSNILKDNRYVYGGGCVEVLMANAVTTKAMNIVGKESIAMKSFARALLKIPTAIADNAGYNADDMISKLKEVHLEGYNTYGLNIIKGKIDCMKVLNIIESFFVKEQLIVAATDAAERIILVNNIFRPLFMEKKIPNDEYKQQQNINMLM